jgi:hypothetical protein
MKSLIMHARAIARFVDQHPAYELLNGPVEEVFVVVLFRARDKVLNGMLRERINEGGEMWVSGTVWEGVEAVRIAVANWKVMEEVEKGQEESIEVVRNVLEKVAGTGGS